MIRRGDREHGDVVLPLQIRFSGPAPARSRASAYRGLENIPDDGPAILASNHLAVMDSFFLPLMVHRRIYFLAKSEYFTGSGLKGGFQRWFFTAVGQIPSIAPEPRRPRVYLRRRPSSAGQGELMGMYPEGTRSPDGRLYKGKTGLARIALDAGVPVIPVAMINTYKLNPPGSILPRPAKIVVRVGKPLDFSRYDGLQGNRFIERAITDEIMYNLDGTVRAAVRRHLRGVAENAPAQSGSSPTVAATGQYPCCGVTRAMKFFYDTEFIEDGTTIDLISVGVVGEDGREFYAVSTEFDPGKAGRLGSGQRTAQAAVAVIEGLAFAPGHPRRTPDFLTADGSDIELWPGSVRTTMSRSVSCGAA